MKVTFPTTPRCGMASINVHLHYDSEVNPYAVKLDFIGGPTWSCARDLLWDGLSSVVGDGDIRIIPGALTVGVRLGAKPKDRVVVVFARDDLATFLRTTYQAVPDGTEHEHVDLSELDRMLEGS